MNSDARPHESEWQAQECARACARHATSQAPDAVPHAYLLVARALRSLPLPMLPLEFAHHVAHMAEIASVGGENTNSSLFDQILTVALGLSFGVAVVFTAVRYGEDWWRTSVSLLPSGSALGWIAMTAACIGMSWLTGRLRHLAT